MELARQHELDAALTPVALQMYWTLYLGVLSFWTNDKSPKQEDTLALEDLGDVAAEQRHKRREDEQEDDDLHPALCH